MSDTKFTDRERAMLEGKMVAACDILRDVAMELNSHPGMERHAIVKQAWHTSEVNRALLRAIGEVKQEPME